MTDILQNFNVYNLILATLIIIGTTWAARYVTSEAERWSDRYIRHRNSLMNGAAVARFAIYVIGIVLAATTLFKFSREGILAAGGALALTAGLAFQDLVSSFVGGITLLIDRPFQVGDRVQFKEHYGEITEIGLRSVRLQTLDDSTVSIPNNQFLKEAVSSGNAGALDMMIVVDFYIDPNSSHDVAKHLIYEAVVTSQYAFLAKPVTVLVSEKIIDVVFCTHLRAKAYVFNTRYEKLFESDITERVKTAFREHGIVSAMTNPSDARLPTATEGA